MMARASMDVGIQIVSICGWADIRHRTTIDLPVPLHCIIPLQLLVPNDSPNRPSSSHYGVHSVHPREPVALALTGQTRPPCIQTSQENKEAKRQIPKIKQVREGIRDDEDLPSPTSDISSSGWLSRGQLPSSTSPPRSRP